MLSIKVHLKLFEATVVFIVIVVSVAVVPLLVVSHADNIQLQSINVYLTLLKADIHFLWWGGWVGFAKSFSCQTQPLC